MICRKGNTQLNKYSEVVGLPIICIDDGKLIGLIRNIIINLETRTVEAFIYEKSGLVNSRKVLFLKDVIRLGKDAVIIQNDNCTISWKEAGKRLALKNENNLTGLRVFSRSGKEMGVVKDILFDPETGLIEGVELSDSLFNDLINGRSILPLFGKVEFGEDIILVDNEAVEEITNTGGGIRNKFFNDKMLT
ncbi:MAG TPA: photosystem reaction center subunit H [Clostridiaceae bacterium]|nr:photosystem reaction center subunit H [Clostridiaceae bacterium]